jgi:hypothetical protein
MIQAKVRTWLYYNKNRNERKVNSSCNERRATYTVAKIVNYLDYKETLRKWINTVNADLTPSFILNVRAVLNKGCLK